MSNLEEIRDKQRANWNKVSAGWKKWDDFLTSWWEPVSQCMFKRASFEATDKVLDVATGTGEPGLSAARSVREGHVTGLDVSEDMLAVAEEKAKAQGTTNYATRHYDGMRLPFEDNHFDVVLSRFGVMFFPDVTAGTRELARVTGQGGRVVISSWLEPARNPFVSVAAKVVFQTLGLTPPPPDAPGIFRCAAPGTLTGLLKEAGLDDVSEEEIGTESDFGTKEEYWDWLMHVPAPIIGAVRSASPEQQATVKSRVLDALGAFEKDGRVILPWAAWVASGRKS